MAAAATQTEESEKISKYSIITRLFFNTPLYVHTLWCFFELSHLKQSNKPHAAHHVFGKEQPIPSVKPWQFQYIEIFLTCICITCKPRYNRNEATQKRKENASLQSWLNISKSQAFLEKKYIIWNFVVNEMNPCSLQRRRSLGMTFSWHLNLLFTG